MSEIIRPMNTGELVLESIMILMQSERKLTLAEAPFYAAVLGYYEAMYKQSTEAVLNIIEKKVEEIKNGTDQDTGGDPQ